MRSQRGWNQKKLAEVMNKPQSVVCRIEDPDYGKLGIQTLLEVGAAYDVALVIQYVGFPEFLRRTRDVSPEALGATSFQDDYPPEANLEPLPETSKRPQATSAAVERPQRRIEVRSLNSRDDLMSAGINSQPPPISYVPLPVAAGF